MLPWPSALSKAPIEPPAPRADGVADGGAHRDDAVGHDPGSAAGSAGTRPVGVDILDAACVIFFAASGQLGLLVKVLAATNRRILMPEEVLEEARTRAGSKGWKLTGLDHYLGSGQDPRISVIPTITAADAEAAALLADVRRRHPNVVSGTTATGSSDDLGECVVVTHGVMASRRGIDVLVGIDDLKAQKLAQLHNLAYFTVEDALCAAAEQGLLTTEELRQAYERMRSYGDSLPSWDAGLKQRIKRERLERKRATVANET